MVAFFFLFSGSIFWLGFILEGGAGGTFGEDSADGVPFGGEMKTATADRVRVAGGSPRRPVHRRVPPAPTGLFGWVPERDA